MLLLLVTEKNYRRENTHLQRHIYIYQVPIGVLSHELTNLDQSSGTELEYRGCTPVKLKQSKYTNIIKTKGEEGRT